MPKRGENIYKRKDGRWEGRYIRGRSPSGRAEYGYVYAGSYRECRAKRQKCLDACREAPVATSLLTLNQAAERFLADKQDDLKRSTLARYTYVLEHYIQPVLGAVLLSQLTANQISEFLRRLQKNGLSGKSARDVGVLLKSILRYSAKKLDCPSPGMTVELPAYRRKQIDIFYPDEIRRLAQMIMDEPTSGLDPIVRNEMLEIFREYVVEEDHTILLSSHITGDLEKLADEVVFIDGGRIVLTGNKDELLEKHGILKCRKQEYGTVDPALVVAKQMSSVGVELLVNDRQLCERRYPDMVMEPASLEEIMIYYVSRAHQSVRGQE